MNGLTVFYMHPNESYQREEHSYPLVPGLTPIIYVKNEELKFLGKPYTECNENSTYWISTCQLEELIDRIQSFCDCTPSYMVARKDSYFVKGRDFRTMRGSIQWSVNPCPRQSRMFLQLSFLLRCTFTKQL